MSPAIMRTQTNTETVANPFNINYLGIKEPTPSRDEMGVVQRIAEQAQVLQAQGVDTSLLAEIALVLTRRHYTKVDRQLRSLLLEINPLCFTPAPTADPATACPMKALENKGFFVAPSSPMPTWTPAPTWHGWSIPVQPASPTRALAPKPDPAFADTEDLPVLDLAPYKIEAPCHPLDCPAYAPPVESHGVLLLEPSLKSSRVPHCRVGNYWTAPRLTRNAPRMIAVGRLAALAARPLKVLGWR